MLPDLLLIKYVLIESFEFLFVRCVFTIYLSLNSALEGSELLIEFG
jgi:hypothetical protein